MSPRRAFVDQCHLILYANRYKSKSFRHTGALFGCAITNPYSVCQKDRTIRMLATEGPLDNAGSTFMTNALTPSPIPALEAH
jgi:hypothetical protein